MVDTYIGPYKILRELTEDRVGRVFEAVDLARRKSVLIKCLRPDFANRPEVVARLYSKAETLALLNHEHIARLFGFIRRDDGLYLVMESVKGEDLESFLKEKGRLDVAVALAFFRQICAAVEFAHHLGVIHGEVKPANVIVTDFARIKVLDFVIATILGNADPACPTPCAARYMSPEQLRGEPVDARSDIYSLGVLCYELIVGKTPFEHTHAEFSKSRVQSTPLPPSLLVPNVPHWLDAFLLRALAPSPAERFQSVTAMTRAIGSTLKAEASKTGSKRGFLSGRGRVNTVSDSLQLPEKGNAQRLASAFAKTANAVRQKHARVKHRAWRGLEATNSLMTHSLLWTRRRATNLSTFGHRIRSAIKTAPIAATRALTHTARETINSARQKASVTSAAIRRGTQTFNPIPLVKRIDGALNDWGRSATSGLKAIQRNAPHLFASLKEYSGSFLQSAWKGYAIIGILITTVMIEILGGANTFLNFDFNSMPLQSQSGAVASLTEPEVVMTPIHVPEETPEPEPKVVKRSNRTQRNLERPNSGIDNLHYQALDARRTVTYRIPRPDSEPPQRPQEPRVSEIARRSENNTGKIQLNVTWEN